MLKKSEGMKPEDEISFQNWWINIFLWTKGYKVNGTFFFVKILMGI